MSICERIRHIQNMLPDNVCFICVTKNQPLQAIQQAYDAGIRDFGENRVHELIEKKAALPQDIRWHFIGTLQLNKVKKIVDQDVFMIHSVDTYKLIEKLSATGSAQQKVVSMLLQVNISGEETKHGFSKDDLIANFTTMLSLPNVQILGLMTMAPDTRDSMNIECARSVFKELKSFRDFLQSTFHYPLPELSMGMSHDYTYAVEEGATFVRLGSCIFSSKTEDKHETN